MGPRRMSENTPTDSSARVQKSECEWREQLRPAQYEVLRRKGTEPPFSGQYVYEKRDGTYRCAA
jgi:peptide-methionine (R)-S-oxide reductase